MNKMVSIKNNFYIKNINHHKISSLNRIINPKTYFPKEKLKKKFISQRNNLQNKPMLT